MPLGVPSISLLFPSQSKSFGIVPVLTSPMPFGVAVGPRGDRVDPQPEVPRTARQDDVEASAVRASRWARYIHTNSEIVATATDANPRVHGGLQSIRRRE